MTVLIGIVLYLIALLLVIVLAGGVRRGDEQHARLLRSMRNSSREPGDAARPERYASSWSKAPKEPKRTPVGRRGRSAVNS